MGVTLISAAKACLLFLCSGVLEQRTSNQTVLDVRLCFFQGFFNCSLNVCVFVGNSIILCMLY